MTRSTKTIQLFGILILTSFMAIPAIAWQETAADEQSDEKSMVQLIGETASWNGRFIHVHAVRAGNGFQAVSLSAESSDSQLEQNVQLIRSKLDQTSLLLVDETTWTDSMDKILRTAINDRVYQGKMNLVFIGSVVDGDEEENGLDQLAPVRSLPRVNHLVSNEKGMLQLDWVGAEESTFQVASICDMTKLKFDSRAVSAVRVGQEVVAFQVEMPLGKGKVKYLATDDLWRFHREDSPANHVWEWVMDDSK